MAHALNTVYCRGALGTRVNPNTNVCVCRSEFDLNTLRVDGEIYESGKKNLRIQKYVDTCGQRLSHYTLFCRGRQRSVTKNYNARKQPLFCSLNLLFSDVAVAVEVFSSKLPNNAYSPIIKLQTQSD